MEIILSTDIDGNEYYMEQATCLLLAVFIGIGL